MIRALTGGLSTDLRQSVTAKIHVVSPVTDTYILVPS